MSQWQSSVPWSGTSSDYWKFWYFYNIPRGAMRRATLESSTRYYLIIKAMFWIFFIDTLMVAFQFHVYEIVSKTFLFFYLFSIEWSLPQGISVQGYFILERIANDLALISYSDKQGHCRVWISD